MNLRGKSLIRKFAALRTRWRIGGSAAVVGHTLAKLRGQTMVVRLKSLGSGPGIDVRMPSSDFEVYRQWFESAESSSKPANKVRTVIDAGANIGVSTRVLAERFPHASIIAVEIEDENFALLEKNTRCLDRIDLVQAALWGEDCDLVLEDGQDGENWSFRAVRGSGYDGRPTSRSVTGLRVSTLMDRFDLRKVDVMKIDIEGGEFEVFQDADHWIDRVDAILIELHDHLRPGASDGVKRVMETFPVQWREGELTCAAREGAAILET